ncbi:hypothetical protein AUF78_09470 [archaeon 13_1_20CM_2_51_12]|nr:MAG: hypothetical protein AUI97_04325 [Crenarchaeota archaeon 13_1_40CM_3_52_17]OLE69810.1 MAG: hypothetical protein AUF78_09470 [archaeon 13_1_20CM_2_51_12]
MLRPSLRYLILFLTIATIVSVFSGTVLTSLSYKPGGVVVLNYGFPLPWQTLSGPTRSCCIITYNSAFLLFDVLIYTAIGYLAFLAYRRLMLGIDRRAKEPAKS